MTAMFDMGAYGHYVWPSVVLALAVYAWNVASPLLRRRALVRLLAEEESDEGGP